MQSRRSEEQAWDPARLPDATDRTLVVTGGNAGIGYFIVEQLASAGARVVIASRDEAKARLAREAILARIPRARIDRLPLDLSRLASAGRAGEALDGLGPIDGIVLNAASLRQPDRRATPDGHELVLGTNHYGNARFLAAALPRLAPNARIVTMGSAAHRLGRLDPDDPARRESRYRPLRVYGTSKLAQMLLALELDRRLRAVGSGVQSLLAHPGGALDGLTPDRPPALAHDARLRRQAALLRPFVQGKDRAAWPAVRAALDPAARGGQLWGPGTATGGRPPRLEPLRGALPDRELARRLWESTTETLALEWGL